MKIQDLNMDDLAQFAENVATLLGGTELSAIDSNVRTDLLTAMGTLPATLATQDSDAMTSQMQTKALFSARDITAGSVQNVLRMTRDQLRATNAPKDQWDLCGFDYPFGPRGTVLAQAPTELSVTGASNGVNEGTFTGNNESGSVTYEVWRREGDEGPWGINRTTTKQRFTDMPVIAGQYYEYKVRAVAAKNISAFSNSAVVYGT